MKPQHRYDLNASITLLEHAFQPIVNIHTGICYGYEALLRNVDKIGFNSIDQFYDHLSNIGCLHEVEHQLMKKAIQKFSKIPFCRNLKLFYNFDSRLFYSTTDIAEETYSLLAAHGLWWEQFCFEISEKRNLSEINLLKEKQSVFRSAKAKIAIDDCGTGFSGLQLMYNTEPNLIKIDRFFISDISTDNKKRLFLSTIVNLAHLMGSLVVAEGVETDKEYYCCRDVGCDLVQGYLVRKPDLNTSCLTLCYEHIRELGSLDRRTKKENDQKLILSEMDRLEPVKLTEKVTDIFETFRTRQTQFLPVISERSEPAGIIRENVFKDYAYSRFGRELLEKVSRDQPLADFISYFPIADVHTPIEKVLEIYSMNENMEGIIITDDLKYIGFLSAQSLLKVLNDKNLAIARDLNPLTKLAGNTLIHEYVSNIVQELNTQCSLVYFDFNNFKVYNDRYGFRQGDRALHLFSQILKRETVGYKAFIGHVGGDDFFLGVTNKEPQPVINLVRNIVSTFTKDMESFYDPKTIKTGYITAKGRDGEKRQFPLMSVSSAIITLPANRSRVFTLENISNIIAVMKKRSKISPSGFCEINLADVENQSFAEFDVIENLINQTSQTHSELALTHPLAAH